MRMAQPKVFVSHSHVDDAFAERLVADSPKASSYYIEPVGDIFYPTGS